MGRRIHKSVTNYTAPSDPNQTFVRSYVYDGGNILLEFDGSNDLLARYTHSLATDDELAVSVRNVSQGSNPIGAPGSYQFLKDGQGSIVDIADTNGNRLQTALYSAYGTRLTLKNGAGVDISNSPILRTTYAFAGRELDPETGLYYNRARYYDSTIGRFLQKDPSPGSLFVPASVVNAYAYSANNPQNLSDPSGMSWLSDHWGAVVAGAEAAITIIGIVVSIVTADPAVTIDLSSDLAAETSAEGGADLLPLTSATMGAGTVAAPGVLAGAQAAVTYASSYAAAATSAATSANVTAPSIQAAAQSSAPATVTQPVPQGLAKSGAAIGPSTFGASSGTATFAVLATGMSQADLVVAATLIGAILYAFYGESAMIAFDQMIDSIVGKINYTLINPGTQPQLFKAFQQFTAPNGSGGNGQ